MNIYFPIQTHQDLYDALPEIHSEVAKQTDNPAIPVLTELNLETELAFQQHEHLMTNESLDNFIGLTAEHIEITIFNTQLNTIRISDVDGRGPIENPRPPTTQNNESLRPIIAHILERQKQVA